MVEYSAQLQQGVQRMLPILLLPLVMPLLLATVNATAGLLEGLALVDVNNWVRIIIVYDLVITAVAVLTFSYVVEG